MNLSELIALVQSQQIFVTADSRQVEPGCVFVALPGTKQSGTDFLQAAKQAGAKYLVSQTALDANIIQVTDARQALGELAKALYGEIPFPIFGVTGTNGKTTVAYLLDHLLTSLGQRVGVLGTVAYRWPGHVEVAPLTTPSCLELHKMFHAMQQAKVEAAIMEVSSHALDQERLAGIQLSGSIFTNLTQDHLDYHVDMWNYFKSKSRLFHDIYLKKPRLMAIGTDNIWGQRLVADFPDAMAFGLEPSQHKSYVQGKILNHTAQGLHLGITYQGQSWELKTQLVGEFNAQNLLAVQALALQLGLPWQAMTCFNDFHGVPGRLEKIDNSQGLNIYVDYAHTPAALTNVLQSLRATGFKRILTVFGAGGDRDTTKRVLMGQAVAKDSDLAIVTSDNPRHENPEAIIDAIMQGLDPARTMRVVDRKTAIAEAIKLMQIDDVLVVAGKGHEATQQIGDVRYPFSDQAIIREILSCS